MKKPFYLSKTFWGLAITAVGAFAPKYAEPLQGAVQDIITTVGLLTALYGRWKAARPLTVQAAPDGLRSLILPLLLLPLFAGSVRAQEYDKVKITAAFSNLNVQNQNLPGANLSVDYKLARYDKWRLGAVVDGAFQHDTNRILDRYQLLGGPQLSYSVGDDRFSFFGRGLFGVTRFDVRRGCQRDFTRPTVGVGGGVDVHLGEHFFIRPAQFDFQWIDDRGARYTRFAVGAGVRF